MYLREDTIFRNILSRSSIYFIRDNCIWQCAKQFSGMDVDVYITCRWLFANIVLLHWDKQFWIQRHNEAFTIFGVYIVRKLSSSSIYVSQNILQFHFSSRAQDYLFHKLVYRKWTCCNFLKFSTPSNVECLYKEKDTLLHTFHFKVQIFDERRFHHLLIDLEIMGMLLKNKRLQCH